jgi:hypothetical protein
MAEQESGPDFDGLTESVAATRAQLFDTLDAIEDRLNVPKQIGFAASKVKRGIQDKPVPYLAAFAGGALAIGGIVVTVLRRR